MDELLHILAHTDLCRQMDGADLDVLKKYLSFVRADANTVLYSQGDSSDAVYVIASGRIEITRKTKDGKLEVLALLRNGDLFGEASLLDVPLRDHSAMSLDDSALYCLETWAYKRMALEHPHVASKVFGALSERIKGKLIERHRGPHPSTHPILCFFSANGGVGKSFLAANAAALAARSLNLRVCLVELDLQFGNLASFFGTQPKKNLWDIIANEDLETVEPKLLENYGDSPCKGLHVFYRPTDIIAAERIQSQHVVSLLHRLQRIADLIVVDCHSGLDEVSLTALDVADHVFVVTTADFGGVATTSSLMRILHNLRYSSKKVQLVVNKSARGHDIPEKDLQPLFEGVSMARLPFDGKVIEALNQNQLWGIHQPSHPICLKILNLIRAFAPLAPRSTVEQKKGSLLQKWFRWIASKPKSSDKGKHGPSHFLMPATDHDRRGALSELAMGQGYFLVGRYDAAARSLEKAVELDPRLSLACYYLGEISRFDGLPEEALLFYEAAAEHSPDNLRYKVKVALASKTPGAMGRELEAIRKSVTKHPNYADQRLLLALVHIHREEYDLAHVEITAALKINPKYVEAWTVRGIAYRREQRRRESLEALIGALTRAPNHVPALFELGELFFETHLYALAKRALTAVLDIYPAHLPSHRRILELQEPLDVMLREVDRYFEAIDLHPDFGDLRYKLSIACYQLGDFDEAIRQANEARRCRFSKTKLDELLGQIGRLYPFLKGTFFLPEEQDAPKNDNVASVDDMAAPDGSDATPVKAGAPADAAS